MCVAIPPTNSKTAGPGKVWLWLTAAPWRFLFTGGLASLALERAAMMLGWSSPIWFAFAVLPFFVTGSVLAVVPRWLGHDVTYDYSFLKNVAALVPAALLMLLYAITGWTWLAAVSAVLVAVSYWLLASHLRYMIFWSTRGDKTTSWLITVFVAAGAVFSLALLPELLSGLVSGQAAGSSHRVATVVWMMNWLSSAPLFLIFALKFLADGSTRAQLVD